MKNALLFGVLFLSAHLVFAQSGTIADFYGYADSAALFPPVDKPLRVVCRHKLDGKFVTFLGFGSDSVARIVAVTMAPLGDPAKEITLTVDFKGITPSIGKVTTWGYLFDRNGDGKVDYLALVGGAAAYKGSDFPEAYARRPQDMSRPQIEYFLAHCRIIFNHCADDNNDGKVDGLVQVDMDPLREWVDHRILVRSTAFDGKFDDVRAFRTSLQTDASDSVKHTPRAVPYHPVGKPRANIDAAMFQERTAILDLVNRAVALCNLPPSRLQQRALR